jgi:hypothetical protein
MVKLPLPDVSQFVTQHTSSTDRCYLGEKCICTWQQGMHGLSFPNHYHWCVSSN